MRDGRVTERVMVVTDIASRLGVVVFLGVVVAKVLDPEIGSDGFPDAFVAPLVAYALWNAAVIGWTIRHTVRDNRTAEIRRRARLLGVGAAIRALWLVPVAGDPFWRSPAMFGLLGATVVTIATATMLAASPGPVDTTKPS